MDIWFRFDERLPAQGQYLAAITQPDRDLPVEEWERDLEKNAVGIWIDGIVWEGNMPVKGLTHWTPLPDRPPPGGPKKQAEFWYWKADGTWELERRKGPRDHR